jgi:large subunit ribosomal protein L21
MYAVIESGGKQFRVELGTEIEVDRLEAEPGQTIQFERVLLVAGDGEAAIGQPTVTNAAVSALVVRRDRGDKVIVFKYRPKARRRVKKGHRQDLTILRIADIVLGDRSAAQVAETQRAERARQQDAAKAAAAAQAEADRQLASRLAREADSETPTDAGATTGETTPAATEVKASGGAATRGRPARAAGGDAPRSRTQAPQPDEPAARPARTRAAAAPDAEAATESDGTTDTTTESAADDATLDTAAQDTAVTETSTETQQTAAADDADAQDQNG